MVSPNGCEKMDSLIQAIISHKSNQIDRLESYQSVLKCLQEDKEIPELFVRNASKILSVLKSDIGDHNTHVVQESLHFLGVFLHCERILSSVDKLKLGDTLEALCSLLASSTDKVVCTRALWCIAKQKIPIIICVEKLDLLLRTMENTSQNPAGASTSMELEAIRVINRFLIDIPDSMTVRIKMWARRLYLATVHLSAKVREAAYMALLAARPSFQKQQSDVLGTLIPDLKEVLVPGMLRLFKEKQELHSLRLWNLLLDILGRTLHQGASLINNLLAVVEKAFKSFAPEVKIAAFKAWQQLITNFGSDLDVLANPKRLRLVMQPLKANNARTEQIAFTKFKVWWHLSVTLGAKLSPNLEMVVYPLFQFCFGTIDGVALNQSVSPGNTSLNSGTPTQKLNSSLNSSAASPSYQKYASINRFGAEALAQILGYGLTLPVSCPSFTIASVGHHVLVPPSGFLRHSEVLMACTREAIANLGAEKRDLHLQLYLWHALVSHIRSSADTDNRKEVSVAVTAFFRVLDDFSKSISPSPEVMLKLLEISTLLPPRILNSSSYNIDNSSVMKGTPALFLLSLLFHPPLLKLSSSQERFMAVFKKLISSGVSSAATSLGFVEEVFKTLETSLQEEEPSDNVYRLWSSAILPLLDSIQKTQEVNQGDTLEHDFRCLYAALIFPIQHLLNKPLLQNSLKTALRLWGELYRSFSQCAALVPNVEANICCEEFCARVIGIIVESILLEDPLFLDNISHLLNIVVSTLDFSPTALQNIPSKILTGSPDKWMKRKQKPLGNLTSLVQLIEGLLTSLKKVATKCNPSDDSSELYQKNKLYIFNATCTLTEMMRSIFTHVISPNVIGPLASKLASSVTLLFQDLAKQDVSKVQQGQLMLKLEVMWNAAASCIQQHYTGPYDSSLLVALHPMLEVTLVHPRKSIRTKSRMLWHSTFEQSYDTLTIPESLTEILKKMKPSLIPGTMVDDAVDELPSSPMEMESQDPFASQEGACATPQKGSFLRKLGAEKSPANQTFKNAKSATPDIASGKRLRLEDINEKEFVKIAPTPKRRRVLTEHQKEVFSTLREVPAMYVDLSQDTLQQPSQFLEDTQTLTQDSSAVVPATNNELASDAAKENMQKQCLTTDGIAVQDSVVVVEESQVEAADQLPELQSVEIISEKLTNDSVEIIHYDDFCKETVSLTSNEAGSLAEPVTTGKQGKPLKGSSFELNEAESDRLSVSVSKHAGNVVNDGLETEISTDLSPSKHKINNVKSVSGELDLVATDSSSEVRVPELATEDQKLRSQPVLEIKRLTSKDIIELSQPTNNDLSDNSLDHSEPMESDMELGSQEMVAITKTTTEITTPKTKVKYVGKRKIATGITTKVHPSISDEHSDDIIPSSQNSESSCSDATTTRTTRSKEFVVQESEVESTGDTSGKQHHEVQDLQGTNKPDEKVAVEPGPPKRKTRTYKKATSEAVALLSDSRITRSAAQSVCGRRRMWAHLPEIKKKRGRPRRRMENHTSSSGKEDKQTEALKSASEESVDSETQQDDETDHQSSDAELSYAAHEAQEGLASYSSTASSFDNKSRTEKLSQEPNITVDNSSPEALHTVVETSPDRKSVPRKSSPETVPVTVEMSTDKKSVPRKSSPETIPTTVEMSIDKKSVPRKPSPETIPMAVELSTDKKSMPRKPSPETIPMAVELSTDKKSMPRKPSPETIPMAVEMSTDKKSVPRKSSPVAIPTAVEISTNKKFLPRKSSPDTVLTTVKTSPEKKTVPRKSSPETITAVVEISRDIKSVPRKSSPDTIPTSVETSPGKKYGARKTSSGTETTRKRTNAKNKSVEPDLDLGQSPADSVRSRRQVKKSLKAILAEETTNVLKKRNYTSETKLKTKLCKTDSLEENAMTEANSAISLDMEEDASQMVENVAIENMQLPTASIDLVKSPILNSVESEMEPVSLIVADTVEVSSKAEDLENGVFVAEEEIFLEVENDKTELNAAEVQLSDAGNEPTDHQEIIASDIQITDKSADEASGTEVDEAKALTGENESIQKVPDDGVADSCPDMFEYERLESSSLTENTALVEIPSAESQHVTAYSTKPLDVEQYSGTEPSLIPAVDIITSCDTSNNQPASDVVNYEIEINSAVLLSKDKKTKKTVKSAELPSDSKAKKDRAKPKSARSSKANISSSTRSSKKETTRKRRSTSPPTPKKNLFNISKSDDDNFKFIAQRNTKTYSREFHQTQSKSPPPAAEPPSSISNKPTNVSPLMQRTGSRAMRMLEAAAKNYLSKYEKMKYEQHRSPDKSTIDDSTTSIGNKTEQRSEVLPISSPQSSKSSSTASVSPALSPSGGILKKYGTFPSLSTPSPVNKRRVSFADPLVQGKEEDRQQHTASRGTVNRCLEMNKDLTNKSLTVQENGSDVLPSMESAADVCQPCSTEENVETIEIDARSEVEEVLMVSAEPVEPMELDKRVPDNTDAAPPDNANKVQHSITSIQESSEITNKTQELTAVDDEVDSVTNRSTVLEAERESPIMHNVIECTDTVIETVIHEPTLPLDEVQTSTISEMEVQHTEVLSSEKQKPVEVHSEVSPTSEQHSELNDTTVPPVETQETILVEKIQELTSVDEISLEPTAVVPGNQNTVVPETTMIETANQEPTSLDNEIQESILHDTETPETTLPEIVIEDSRIAVASIAVDENAKLVSPCVEIKQSTALDTENKITTVHSVEETVDLALCVSDNRHLSLGVSEKPVQPAPEYEAEVEMVEATTVEIAVSSEIPFKADNDECNSLGFDNVETDTLEEVVEMATDDAEVVITKHKETADASAVNTSSSRTELVSSDDSVGVVFGDHHVNHSVVLATKVFSDDEESVVNSSSKLSPVLKRNHIDGACFEGAVTSGATEDLVDGEPEVKRRRVDLYQLTEELCSLFTDENLSTLPGQKIMTLQERLCSMSLAVTSSLLKRSTDIQHDQSPE